MTAKDIAVRAATIAADLDTSSNANFVIEEIDCTAGGEDDPRAASNETGGSPSGSGGEGDGGSDKKKEKASTTAASSGDDPTVISADSIGIHLKGLKASSRPA